MPRTGTGQASWDPAPQTTLSDPISPLPTPPGYVHVGLWTCPELLHLQPFPGCLLCQKLSPHLSFCAWRAPLLSRYPYLSPLSQAERGTLLSKFLNSMHTAPLSCSEHCTETVANGFIASLLHQNRHLFCPQYVVKLVEWGWAMAPVSMGGIHMSLSQTGRVLK